MMGDPFLESGKLFLESCVQPPRERRKVQITAKRRRFEIERIKQFAKTEHIFVSGGNESSVNSAIRALRNEIDQVFRSVEIKCSYSNDQVISIKRLKEGELVGYYTGHALPAVEENSSLYLVRSQITRTDLTMGIFIDAHLFKMKEIKEFIIHQCQENLMCFINHGCPGCANVKLRDIDEFPIVFTKAHHYTWTFAIPCLVATREIDIGEELRFDYRENYGASSKEQLEADGYDAIQCNCPMHKEQGFPDWYIPDSATMVSYLKKMVPYYSRKEKDAMQENSLQTYLKMKKYAIEHNLIPNERDPLATHPNLASRESARPTHHTRH